jgi:hypothetical protein
MISSKTSFKPLPLLYRAQSTTLSAAGTVSMPKFRVDGYKRIVGNFHVTTAAAAGYPRIRQSADGVNWSLVYTIAVDPTQSNFQYPFDIEVRLPYVSVEYTQGGVDSASIYCWAEARPD